MRDDSRLATARNFEPQTSNFKLKLEANLILILFLRDFYFSG